jgi:hypothetical protein
VVCYEIIERDFQPCRISKTFLDGVWGEGRSSVVSFIYIYIDVCRRWTSAIVSIPSFHVDSWHQWHFDTNLNKGIKCTIGLKSILIQN